MSVVSALVPTGRYAGRLNRWLLLLRAPGTSASTTSQPGSGTILVTIGVTYAAGWNLVAGCNSALPQAAATLYTFQAQDASYETLPNTNTLTTGVGY